jgi:hypothetical protein
MSDSLIPAAAANMPRAYTPVQAQVRFDLKLARPFIYKSLSEETRAAYRRAIREFFQFVGGVHPAHVTPADVQAYRDISEVSTVVKSGVRHSPVVGRGGPLMNCRAVGFGIARSVL